MAGLTLAFVLFNRPRAATCMRRRDVSFTAHGLKMQVVDFKMALRKTRERLAFTVLINLTPDKQEKVAALVRLVVKQQDAAGRHPDAMLFADLADPPAQSRFWLAARVTNVWLKHLLVLFPTPAPLGRKYQGHSLRSGAGSQASAIGLPLPMIAEIMGPASRETTLRSYARTR